MWLRHWSSSNGVPIADPVTSVGLGSSVKMPVSLSFQMWTNESALGVLFLREDHVWPSLGVVRLLKQGDNKRKKVYGPSWDGQSRPRPLGSILGQW